MVYRPYMSSVGCPRNAFRAALGLLCFASAGLAAPGGALRAQTHLLGASSTTRVRAVTFVFEDGQVESVETLKGLIATRAPSLRDRLPWPFNRPGDLFLLDPIELQRDVVRLRNHLQAQGFLHAHVDYAASTYDARKDAIRVRFTIRHGPPVIIQDVGFYTVGGYLASAFEGDMRTQWIEFRDRTTFRAGDRLTSFKVVQIEDEVLGWLKNQSYAFATLYTVTSIDSVYNTADIDFLVDPGPPGIIDEVRVEGNRRVHRSLVHRELPFKVGDAFSNRVLLEGQRELFALNLFQVAQVHVPPQVRDSTVTVHVDLREARLRYVTAETGYDQRAGFWGEGRWSHRNFLGGARVLGATAEIQTGLLSTTPTLPHRLARASLALTQPYLLVRKLAAVVEPYVQLERDPLLLNSERSRSINRREYGVNSTLLYGLLTTRAVTLQYNLGRTTAYSSTLTTDLKDTYGKGVLTLGSIWGWTDNLLNPRRGYTVQSSVEHAGGVQRLLGLAGVGLKYSKVSVETSGFMPMTQDLFVGLRIAAGRMWPAHDAFVTLWAHGAPAAFDAQFTAPLENRFDPVRFYVGGNDVRGWSSGHVGPKVNRTKLVTDDTGTPVYDGDLPLTSSARYEPVGGLTRVSAGLELWYRLSGPWRVALFADAGQVSAAETVTPGCTSIAYRDRAQSQPVPVQCGLRDDGRIDWGGMRFGTGAGVRYATPIGFVRVDVAAKINPGPLDLQSPRNAFLTDLGLIEPKRQQLNRLAVHVSIGQAF